MSLVESVQREVESLGAIGTAFGQMAIHTASVIELGESETGIASNLRVLKDLMIKLHELHDSSDAVDELDELRRSRDGKRRGRTG